MPGSDDQYDQVHTYSQDHAGKSKTTKPAVREVGRDGAPVRLFVGDNRDETAVRTPPTGVVYWFFNTNGNPRVIDSTGTIASPVDGQAISPQSITADQGTITNLDGTDLQYELVTLDQDADDGTDRIIVKSQDGTERAEIYYDGTDTLINPLTDAVSIPGPLSTDQVSITEVAGRAALGSNQSVSSSTATQVNLDTNEIESTDAAVIDVDLANNKLIAKKAGVYTIRAQIQFLDSSNWSSGDVIAARIKVGGTLEDFMNFPHPGSSGSSAGPTVSVDMDFEVTSPNKDIIMEARHTSGSTETVNGDTRATNLEVTFQG